MLNGHYTCARQPATQVLFARGQEGRPAGASPSMVIMEDVRMVLIAGSTPQCSWPECISIAELLLATRMSFSVLSRSVDTRRVSKGVNHEGF